MRAATLTPRGLRAILAPALAGALLLLATPAAPAAAFDAAAWQADFDALEHALEARYPNLAWLGSPRGGVDLVALDRRTRAALAAARTDAQAEAAITGFVDALHDGHLQRVPREPAAQAPAPGASAAPRASDCSALEIEPPREPGFSAALANLPGFSADAAPTPFPAAQLRTPHGLRLGAIRIASFTEMAYPSLCARALRELQEAHVAVTAHRLRDAMADDWLEALAAALGAAKQHGVDALVVDIRGNAGGNDAGDWSVRMFTPAPVRSARLLMAPTPGAAAYAETQSRHLRRGLDKLGDAAASAPLAAQMRQSLDEFGARRGAAGAARCDLSWVWRERRDWNEGLCKGLVDMGFASGGVAYLAPVAPRERDIASYLYWPAQADAWRGAWSGPVYVLVDAQVWSSAEMFAASMRDNGVARIVGQRTGGAGCGNMGDDPLIELPHSGLAFHLPDCVRLRADGSDEVAGVEPDLPVAPIAGEDAAAHAGRLVEAIERDLLAHRPPAR